MASYTTNLNLKKPAGGENVNIGDINGNMDTIDAAVGVLQNNYAKNGTMTSEDIWGCYGFITSGGTYMALYIPMNLNSNISGVTITNMTIELRTSAGGYVLSSGENVTPYIDNIYMHKRQGMIRVDINKNDGFGVTNNTPVIGSCTITGSFT